MDMSDAMKMAVEVDRWLDTQVPHSYAVNMLAQDWARIAKVQEEAGEVVAAFIGATGQNPRKGITHDMNDVISELGDVAFTAILAILHFTKDPVATEEVLWNKLVALSERVPPEYRVIAWTQRGNT